MTGVIPVIPRFKFTDASGNPLSGGSVTVYLAGTTTLANTFQDKALTIANTNPVALDAHGECLFWVDPANNYKLLLKDSHGATIPGWPVDNVSCAGSVADAAAAAAVAAQPYVTAAPPKPLAMRRRHRSASSPPQPQATPGRPPASITTWSPPPPRTRWSCGCTTGPVEADTGKRFPSSYAVIQQAAKIGGTISFVPGAAIGNPIVTGTAAATGTLWSDGNSLPAGELQSVTLWVQTLGNGTGSIVVTRPGSPATELYVIPVTGIAGTGSKTVAITSGTLVQAGDVIGWHAATGGAQIAFGAGGVSSAASSLPL
jgi:hypothetical protein